AVLNISEDKSNVFIEVSLSEGEQYQFGEVNFLGKPTFDNSELKELVTFAPDEKYSQAKLDATTAAMTSRYGNAGLYIQKNQQITHKSDQYRVSMMRPKWSILTIISILRVLFMCAVSTLRVT